MLSLQVNKKIFTRLITALLSLFILSASCAFAAESLSFWNGDVKKGDVTMRRNGTMQEVAVDEVISSLGFIPKSDASSIIVVLEGKKICGILTEMGTEFMEIKYVVIGTGINVNQEEFPEELRKTATSLYLETGKKYHRSRIIERILEALEEYYGIFVKTEDMSALLEEYNEKLVNRGQEVCVLDPKGEYRGLCQGITKTGGLLVELSDGTVTEVISGEVSVRGVYGYV